MPYGIIHTKIFDSTVMAEGYEVVYVFQCMITLADQNDVVDMGLAALANRINMPKEKVEHALKRLGLPDDESKSSREEGRRIIPLSEVEEIDSNRGWFIVNREEYIEEASKERRNSYIRKKMRERRGGKGVNKGGNVNSELTHVDVNIDIDLNKKKIPPTLEMVTKYIELKKYPIDPVTFFNHYQATDWMRGKNKIKDWWACVETWVQRDKKEAGKIELPDFNDDKGWQKLADKYGVKTTGLSRQQVQDKVRAKLKEGENA